MSRKVKPIRTNSDYEAALAQLEQLWGAKSGTPRGEQLDALATLIDAYEVAHFPIKIPNAIEAMKFRAEQEGLLLPGLPIAPQSSCRAHRDEPRARPRKPKATR